MIEISFGSYACRGEKNISGIINVDQWDLLRGMRHDTQLSWMKKNECSNKMEETTGYDHVYSSVYIMCCKSKLNTLSN